MGCLFQFYHKKSDEPADRINDRLTVPYIHDWYAAAEFLNEYSPEGEWEGMHSETRYQFRNKVTGEFVYIKS